MVLSRTEHERRGGLPGGRWALLVLLSIGCGTESGHEGDEALRPRPADEGEETAPVAEPTPEREPVTEPIDCDGDETIAAEDITIRTDRGPAIRAGGGCQVTLTRAELSSGGVAVVASGSAQVVLRDSQVRGGSAAVVVSDDASVAMPGTEVHGEVRLQGEGATDG